MKKNKKNSFDHMIKFWLFTTICQIGYLSCTLNASDYPPFADYEDIDDAGLAFPTDEFEIQEFYDEYPGEGKRLDYEKLKYYDPGVPAAKQNASIHQSSSNAPEITEITTADYEIQNYVSFPPNRGQYQKIKQDENIAQAYPFEDDSSYSLIEKGSQKTKPLKYVDEVTDQRSAVDSGSSTNKRKHTLHLKGKSNQQNATKQVYSSGASKPIRTPSQRFSNNEIAQLSDLKDEREPIFNVNNNENNNLNTIESENSASTNRESAIIKPDSNPSERSTTTSNAGQASSSRTPPEEISIKFNNVSMIEYLQFLTRVANKSFTYNEEDLQFNVTIVGEEPMTVDNFMSALLQELRVRDLLMIEQGNNIIIHRNPRVRSPARVVFGETQMLNDTTSEFVTRIFRLNTLDPLKASEIIRPLLSDDALVEVLRDSNNLIITDLVTNVNKITQLISNLDAPNSGMKIGQFVVRNAFVDSLVDLANKILLPIAQGNPFNLVPHAATNSIYIVSNSFLVEKALAILQNLDEYEGRTKILSLENLYPLNVEGLNEVKNADKNVYVAPLGYRVDNEGYLIGPDGQRVRSGNNLDGFERDANGFYRAISETVPAGQDVEPGQNLLFAPGKYQIGRNGYLLDDLGRLVAPGSSDTAGFPVGPDGWLKAREGIAFPDSEINLGTQGQINSDGNINSFLNETRDFLPGGIHSVSNWSDELPTGHIERTTFSIYKLRYRRGDQIEIALRKIALSLQETGTSNIDLLAAINSVQWIESSNSMIITGTPAALEKIRDLIIEIDTPLRQVFIEMLVLATTLQDSLQYGVQINQFSGGGSTLTSQGFNGNIGAEAASAIDYTTNPPTFSDIGSVFGGLGYSAAVVGTHITHCGMRFNTISALVKALHQNSKTRIVLNPKIIAEDNTTAEIFVGTTDRYKSQSITNDLGTLVTNNFQFIDVGTLLKVTPLIGNNNVITLDIYQETSNGDDTANTTAGGSNNTATTDVNLVPVISTSRTQTRVHIPNGFFIIISGLIQDVESRVENRVPCLGGIPIIGGAFKQKGNEDRKQNLMIFIRPLIVDTESELEDITRRQQDVFREKSKLRRDWNYELKEGLDYFNVIHTDLDENCRDGR